MFGLVEYELEIILPRCGNSFAQAERASCCKDGDRLIANSAGLRNLKL